MKTRLVGIVGVLYLLSFLVGCSEAPRPRLHALFETEMNPHQRPDSVWPQLQRIGLVVHSDTTGPGAAPAISPVFLETLSQRTENLLAQRCGVSSVVPTAFPISTANAQIQEEFLARGQEEGISHVLLVVLSSREYSSPVTLGEERIMTQMSGTAIESTALAEVALLRLAEYHVVMALATMATETLELLDAPIGQLQYSPAESLEILRAQAGQQALDRSLHHLGQWCEGIPQKDWS